MYFAFCGAAIPIYLGWHALALGLGPRPNGTPAARSPLRMAAVVLLALLSAAYILVVADAWYREVWNAAGAGFSSAATKKTGAGLIGIVMVGIGALHYFVTGRPKPLSELERRRIAAKTARTVRRLMEKHGNKGEGGGP